MVRTVIAAFSIALIVATAADAVAQSAPPPPGYTPPVETRKAVRKGLTFGFGLGVGSLVADCDDCNATFEAVGLSGHIGWMLTPRLALVLDAWGMVHSEAFLVVYQNINTIAARFWLTPRLWAGGGFGNANAGYQWSGLFVDREDQTEKTAGIMIGAGYELRVRPSFVVDLEFRYGTGFYDQEVAGEYVVKGHNVSIGVGLNWY